MLTNLQDAYGHQLYVYFRGTSSGLEIVERDDGLIQANLGPALCRDSRNATIERTNGLEPLVNSENPDYFRLSHVLRKSVIGECPSNGANRF